MAHAQSLDARPRRRMALALLATTALAALLGGCTQTGLPFGGSEEPKLSATDAIGAIAQWSAAYNKNPQDPKLVLGYAAALKNIGSRDKALEILTAGYRANQNNGEIAAELGRLALDMGRLDIAQQTLKVAETQGVKDWKTLSAQGTLRAKQGRHAEAQQYFLAALEVQPDAVSVINNLALSYALDGKPNKSEELLRKAVASGHDDKRVRQESGPRARPARQVRRGAQSRFARYERPGRQVEHDLSPQHAVEPDAVRRGLARWRRRRQWGR